MAELAQRKALLAAALAEALGETDVEVSSVRSCSGGSIHRAEWIALSDGRAFFLKSGCGAHSMFVCEVAGLQALAQQDVVRVPQVVGQTRLSDREDCLILEAIASAAPRDDYWQIFGRGFALLHRASSHDRYGFSEDNFIGSTPQPNGWLSDWIEFFAQRRLGFQLRLARDRQLISAEFYRLTERLLQRLREILAAPEEPAALLHGDLWSGNYLVDERGGPVIIDPAVYYGRREADLAMPLLFGGFDSAFFTAYDETWPLADGWRDRVELYKLYHLMNHLNLFGESYLASCLAIARRFA